MKKILLLVSFLLLTSVSAFSIEQHNVVGDAEPPAVEAEEQFWNQGELPDGTKIWYCTDENFRAYVVPILNTYGYWVEQAETCAKDFAEEAGLRMAAEDRIEGLETWRTVLGVTSVFLLLGNIGGVLLW